jgi:DNA polymerase/3'-5' exonuclease PolX
MSYTYDELKRKTVAQLREIAGEQDHPALQGYTQLNKEHLLEALCKALDVEMRKQAVVVDIDKTEIKSKIKNLRQKRDAAIAAGDHEALKKVRRAIHRQKRILKRSTVQV